MQNVSLRESAESDIIRDIEKLRDGYASMVQDLNKVINADLSVVPNEASLASLHELTTSLTKQLPMLQLTTGVLATLLGKRE